jgi:hypothetical protein
MASTIIRVKQYHDLVYACWALNSFKGRLKLFQIVMHAADEVNEPRASPSLYLHLSWPARRPVNLLVKFVALLLIRAVLVNGSSDEECMKLLSYAALRKAIVAEELLVHDSISALWRPHLHSLSCCETAIGEFKGRRRASLCNTVVTANHGVSL